MFDFGEDDILFETPLTVVVPAGNPIRPGHIIVTPKKYHENVTSMTGEEYSDMYLTVQRFTKVMREKGYANGFNTFFPVGHEASQNMDRIYMQVIPRTEGDKTGDDIFTLIDEYQPSVGNVDADLKKCF